MDSFLKKNSWKECWLKMKTSWGCLLEFESRRLKISRASRVEQRLVNSLPKMLCSQRDLELHLLYMKKSSDNFWWLI